MISTSIAGEEGRGMAMGGTIGCERDAAEVGAACGCCPVIGAGCVDADLGACCSLVCVDCVGCVLWAETGRVGSARQKRAKVGKVGQCTS